MGKVGGNEVRPGMAIEHNGQLWSVVKTQAVKPGKGGAYYQVELKNILNGSKLNERFRSAETVDEVGTTMHQLILVRWCARLHPICNFRQCLYLLFLGQLRNVLFIVLL